MPSDYYIVIENPQSAVLAATRISATLSAPPNWQPGRPLNSHRPPYPTEDLMRQSSLFSLMTKKKSLDVDRDEPSIVKPVEPVEPSITTTTTTSAPSRRRKGTTTQDKAKLLDLDLNPDL